MRCRHCAWDYDTQETCSIRFLSLTFTSTLHGRSATQSTEALPFHLTVGRNSDLNFTDFRTALSQNTQLTSEERGRAPVFSAVWFPLETKGTSALTLISRHPDPPGHSQHPRPCQGVSKSHSDPPRKCPACGTAPHFAGVQSRQSKVSSALWKKSDGNWLFYVAGLLKNKLRSSSNSNPENHLNENNCPLSHI